MKNKAAQQLGRLGGKVSSEAKAQAARANGAKGGRVGMYSVDSDGDTVDHSLSKAAAVTLAKQRVAAGDRGVFIRFHRASDGQRGFLNPGGGHDLTGRDWAA